MESMTWDEIEQSISQLPFLLIPLGPRLKEHGYHLPMNTDYIMAEYFRDELLKSFKILSASTIDMNYFPAFTEYPGSEHLHFETAIQLVYEKCQCHIKHGITHIYIINMGISTNSVLEVVKEKLKKHNVLMEYTNHLYIDAAPEIKALQQQERGTHADELETSMMLYIRPEVVRFYRAIKDNNLEKDPNRPGPLTRNPCASSGVYSPTGVWGDPTLASYEKGRVIVSTYLELMKRDRL